MTVLYKKKPTRGGSGIGVDTFVFCTRCKSNFESGGFDTPIPELDFYYKRLVEFKGGRIEERCVNCWNADTKEEVNEIIRWNK